MTWPLLPISSKRTPNLAYVQRPAYDFDAVRMTLDLLFLGKPEEAQSAAITEAGTGSASFFGRQAFCSSC